MHKQQKTEASLEQTVDALLAWDARLSRRVCLPCTECGKASWVDPGVAARCGPCLLREARARGWYPFDSEDR